MYDFKAKASSERDDVLLDSRGLLLPLCRIWAPTPWASSWSLPQFLSATPFSLLRASPFFCPSWPFPPSKELCLYVFSVCVSVYTPTPAPLQAGQIAGLSGLEERTAHPTCSTSLLPSFLHQCFMLSVRNFRIQWKKYFILLYIFEVVVSFDFSPCELLSPFQLPWIKSFYVHMSFSQRYPKPLENFLWLLISLPLLPPSYTSQSEENYMLNIFILCYMR